MLCSNTAHVMCYTMQGVCQHSLFDALHNARLCQHSLSVCAGSACVSIACLMRCMMQGMCHYSLICLCRLQQVRSLWSEIPHIQKAVEKLSKECMDLLNRIFVVDDKKRITIEAIKEHPWSAPHPLFPLTLTPVHAALLAVIFPHLSILLPVCPCLTSCDLIVLRLSSLLLL